MGILLLGAPAVNNRLLAKSLLSGFDLNEGLVYGFQNFCKNLVSLGAGSSFNFPAFMNSDGYPSTSLSGQGSGIDTTTSLPASATGSGVTWVISWSGKGGIQMTTFDSAGISVPVGTGPGGHTFRSFVNGGSGTPGQTCALTGTDAYVEFTFPANNAAVNFSFSQFNMTFDGTMSNLQMYRKSDQNVGQTGTKDIFTPEFIAKLTALNLKIIRTMDWTSTNHSNVSSWAQRRPTTAVSYLTDHWMTDPSTGLYAGDTSGTNTYTCSAPPAGFTLVDNATLQVRFVNACTSTTPTLNVNGTGAKTIVDRTYSPLTIGLIEAGALATLLYDAWLDVFVLSVSQPSNHQVSGGLVSTIPPEIEVALCNQMQCALWHCIPAYYTNASVTSMVQFFAANLSGKLYLEYTNEHWNSAVFSQSALCKQKGTYLGFPSDSGRQENGYFGLRLKQIADIAIAAWVGAGRSRSDLKMVNTTQGQSGDPTAVKTYQFNGTDLFVGNPAFTNGNYASVINASYNVGSPTFSRPMDISDCLSYATYFAGAVFSNGGDSQYSTSYLSAADIAALTGASDDYASGNPTRMSSALAWLDNDFRRGVVQINSVTLPSGLSGNTFTSNITPNFTAGAGPNFDYVTITPSAGGSLPTGLSQNTQYFVVNQNAGAKTFQLALTRGGSVISVSGGSGTMTIGASGSETLLTFKNLVYPIWESIAATYDSARPSGLSNVTSDCYEGALEALAPTIGECSNLGISTSYSAALKAMLLAYKNDLLANQLVQDQYADFMSQSHSRTPGWFTMAGGGSAWGLVDPDGFSTPYKTFDGIAYYNTH